MPRVRQDPKVLKSVTALVNEVEVEMRDGDNPDKTPHMVKVTYQLPKDESAFQEWVLTLSNKAPSEDEDSPLRVAFEDYWRGLDSRCRAAAKTSEPETTKFRYNGELVDIMDSPLPHLIVAINGTFVAESITGKKVPIYYRTARKLLLEQGKVRDEAGMLVELAKQ